MAANISPPTPTGGGAAVAQPPAAPEAIHRVFLGHAEPKRPLPRIKIALNIMRTPCHILEANSVSSPGA